MSSLKVHSDLSLTNNTNDLLKTVASILEELINEKETQKNKQTFRDCEIQNKIYELLTYLHKFVKFSDSSLIIALIYIDRLINKSKLKINNDNIIKILIISLIVSIKYNEDSCHSNSFYSKITGIKTDLLTKFETKFIISLEFSLFVSEESYQKYCDFLSMFVNDYSTEKKLELL